MVSSTAYTCRRVYLPFAYEGSLQVKVKRTAPITWLIACASLLVFLVPILATFSPFSTQQLARSFKHMSLPCLKPFKGSHCMSGSPDSWALRDLVVSASLQCDGPPTAPHLLGLSHTWPSVQTSWQCPGIIEHFPIPFSWNSGHFSPCSCDL